MCSTFSRCSISSFSAGPIRKACKNRLLFIRKLRPVMMFSKTLMPLNNAKFWKVRAIPILATAWLSIWSKVCPRKVIVPSCGVYTPLMQLSIELLPAPLGPMMARTSCSRTLKEISVSAFTPPKRKLMFWTSRMTSPIFLLMPLAPLAQRFWSPRSARLR